MRVINGWSLRSQIQAVESVSMAWVASSQNTCRCCFTLTKTGMHQAGWAPWCPRQNEWTPRSPPFLACAASAQNCCCCLQCILFSIHLCMVGYLTRCTSCCDYESCLTRSVMSFCDPTCPSELLKHISTVMLSSLLSRGLVMLAANCSIGLDLGNRFQTTRHCMSSPNMMRWCMHSQLSLAKSAFLQSSCVS